MLRPHCFARFKPALLATNNTICPRNPSKRYSSGFQVTVYFGRKQPQTKIGLYSSFSTHVGPALCPFWSKPGALVLAHEVQVGTGKEVSGAARPKIHSPPRTVVYWTQACH